MNARVLAVTDQAVSSASNVAITIVAARMLDPHGFGGFALAMTFYLVAIGIGRALATEPLLLKGRDRAANQLGDSVGAMVVLGLAAALVGAGVAAVAGGAEGTTLLILSLFLPLLFLQDGWRFGAFAREEPSGALFVDAVWLGAQAVGTILLLLRKADDSDAFMAMWAAAGAVAGIAGGIRLRAWPRLLSGSRWMLSNRRFGGPFLIEFLAAGGANYAGLAVLAVISGVVAVGAVRVGQTVFGPVGIAYQGVFLTLVPEGARHRATNIGQLRRPMVRASIVLGAVAALWTAVLLVIPGSVGRVFFGATWADARPVLLPLGVAFCGGGIVAGAAAGLRALGAAWLGLRVRLITLPFMIVLPILGAVIGDEVGFCAGVALATWLALGLWWATFGKALAAPPAFVTDEDVHAAEAGLIAGPP